jgi:hypothetical protein
MEVNNIFAFFILFACRLALLLSLMLSKSNRPRITDKYHFFAEWTFYLKVDSVCDLVLVLHVGRLVVNRNEEKSLFFLNMLRIIANICHDAQRDFDSLLRSCTDC